MLKLKKSVFVFAALGLVFGGIASNASTAFEDEVDSREAAEAVIRCADDAKQLIGDSGEYLGSIVGKHTKDPSGDDIKTYTLESLRGGGFGRPEATVVATLVVTQKITHSAGGPWGVSHNIEWSCSLKK